ncbi:hypothetical protein HBH98_031230 [Parastagonospora nodorum]|nr:hypothetical protein HBH52_046620 [Parastagonospora nodorum]KAH4071168.1 hypothetical protein HBH50_077310 [Parastagonospora nodorum]KAH4093864.1 hypothetical protein HBH48_065560 [Parastagonospora nodorum]KAH4109610.1 hypothetical protein HBH46_029620 [Parastagonospora nodorum]KAH4196591.1 hypothetical protein HBH42_067600 [Parastagonospora nodorum]
MVGVLARKVSYVLPVLRLPAQNAICELTEFEAIVTRNAVVRDRTRWTRLEQKTFAALANVACLGGRLTLPSEIPQCLTKATNQTRLAWNGVCAPHAPTEHRRHVCHATSKNNPLRQ